VLTQLKSGITKVRRPLTEYRSAQRRPYNVALTICWRDNRGTSCTLWRSRKIVRGNQPPSVIWSPSKRSRRLRPRAVCRLSRS